MWQRWHLVGFCSVLGILLACTSGEVLGQKKGKKAVANPEQLATAADYTQIKNSKELNGAITTIDSANKTLSLRVEIPHYEPNPNYKPPAAPKMGPGVSPQAYAQAKYQFDQWKLSQDIMKQQQRIMQAKTPQERQKAMYQYQLDLTKYQQHQMLYMAKMSAQYAKGAANPNTNPNNQPFKVVTTTKEYTLEMQDAVVVRKTFLGTEYGDTGNIKQYSDKEKEELRGKDRTKPGYTAKMEDLLPGQQVKLSLTAPKAKKKDKDAPAEDEDGLSDRPTINMIVMTKEMSAGATEPANPKKGKK